MKKLVNVILILCLLVSSLSNTIYADNKIVKRPDIKILIDGTLKKYSLVPISINGRTLLPLREVLVSLGVQNDNQHIIWNSSDRSVSILKESTNIYLKVNSTEAKLNGTTKIMDVCPVNFNNKVYIPVRFISECLGKKITWDGKKSAIMIEESKIEDQIIDQIKDQIKKDQTKEDQTKEDQSKETVSNDVEEVTVDSVEELVEEIDSNRKIVLKPGIYNLSKLDKNVKSKNCVVWKDVDDGKELNIINVSNLTIEGSGIDKTELKVEPRFANILYLKNVKNFTFKNIKAGHTPSEYDCNAGVLAFEGCQDIVVSDSLLYGCGSVGLFTYKTKGLTCENTIIEHCSLRAVDIDISEGIKFYNDKFTNNEAFSNIALIFKSKDICFEECDITDNVFLSWNLFETYDSCSNVLINKCTIKNNSTPNKLDKNETTPMFKTDGNIIKVTNTEINGNAFDQFTDKPGSVKTENCNIKNNSWQ